MTARIERARSSDGPAIVELLHACGLPDDGVLDHLDGAVVARTEARVVGCAALEVYDDGALLRSVAVAPEMRGGQLGNRLVRAALELAGRLNVSDVYLLTTTAPDYFPRFGFERILRATVPPGVQQSVEFTSVCPVSAVVMRRPI